VGARSLARFTVIASIHAVNLAHLMCTRRFDDGSFNRWRRIPRSTDAYTTPKKNKEDKRQDMLFRGSTTVSVKFTNNYRQHCEKRKAPVFHLLRGRF